MRVIVSGCWRKVFHGEIYEDVVALCSSSRRSKPHSFNLADRFIRRASLLARASLGFLLTPRVEMREKCFCIDGGRRTTLAVLNRSQPHIAAFKMTWQQQNNQKGREVLGLWLHIKPSPRCIHAFLAPSPRGVMCKWVPGSALSVWQHSACEGPTDARNQAARPSLVLHPWGFAI